MTKKITIILFISLIFLQACTPNEEEAIDESIDFTDWVDKVDLPNNFSLEIDPEEIETVETASTYLAAPLEFDEEILIDTLLSGEVTKEDNYAVGPYFQAKNGDLIKYLIIYDGGKSFGEETGVFGGFTYGTDHYFINKLSTVISNAPGPPDNDEKKLQSKLRTDYLSESNLSFMDYDEALNKITDLFSSIGFPSMEVAESYSLDLETMLENYEYYLAENEWTEDIEEYDWSEDDEAYLFFFRQTLDGIPLSNLYWQIEATTTNEVLATSSTVAYTRDGVMDLDVYSLFETYEKLEEKNIISRKEALSKVINNYSDLIIPNETRLISMELNYISIYKKENVYELVPVWVLIVAENYKETDPINETEYTGIFNNYFVINAFTGERIERASDSK